MFHFPVTRRDQRRFQHADGSCFASTGNIESGPVVNGAAHKRQAEGDGDGAFEIEGFTGDMPLIVIKREDGVIAAQLAKMENGICRWCR